MIIEVLLLPFPAVAWRRSSAGGAAKERPSNLTSRGITLRHLDWLSPVKDQLRPPDCCVWYILFIHAAAYFDTYILGLDKNTDFTYLSSLPRCRTRQPTFL